MEATVKKAVEQETALRTAPERAPWQGKEIVVVALSTEQLASHAGSDDSEVVITHVVSHSESEPAGPLPPVWDSKGKKNIGEDDEEEEEKEER